MKLRNYIKVHTEKIPFLMVVWCAMCYVMTFFDFYTSFFEVATLFTEVSLLFILVLYGMSEKWGFVAKKSLFTLCMLNLINFINNYLSLEMYYHVYNVFTYTTFLTIIIYKRCKSI